MQINMSLAAGTISDPLDSTITGLARRYVDNKLGEPIGKLFFPQLPPPMWNDITHEQAIQAIDNFLENGNPRWATIMKERT